MLEMCYSSRNVFISAVTIASCGKEKRGNKFQVQTVPGSYRPAGHLGDSFRI